MKSGGGEFGQIGGHEIFACSGCAKNPPFDDATARVLAEIKTLKTIRKCLKDLCVDQSANAATEYALMLALIVVVSIAAISAVGEGARDNVFATISSIGEG